MDEIDAKSIAEIQTWSCSKTVCAQSPITVAGKLTRTVDVPKPVRHKALTTGQAEGVLRNLELRVFHGG